MGRPPKGQRATPRIASSINWPVDIYRQLEELSAYHETPIQSFVVEAVKAYLDTLPREGEGNPEYTRSRKAD